MDYILYVALPFAVNKYVCEKRNAVLKLTARLYWCLFTDNCNYHLALLPRCIHLRDYLQYVTQLISRPLCYSFSVRFCKSISLCLSLY